MKSIILDPSIAEACQRFRVKRLYAFGSFANEDHTEDSDVDLIVDFEREGFEGAFEQFVGFKDYLEKILGRPVDLVVEKPFRNPAFQEEVDQTKKLVYAA